MRLFITKQSCRRLRVSGHISDEDATVLDAAQEGSNEESDIMGELETDNKLLVPINDCNDWDGTAEQLIDHFLLGTLFLPKNSNEKFSYDRDILALEYIKQTTGLSRYNVPVEKRMYCTGLARVCASSPENAQAMAETRINNGMLQTTDVMWSYPVDEDMAFQTTGDVD